MNLRFAFDLSLESFRNEKRKGSVVFLYVGWVGL